MKVFIAIEKWCDLNPELGPTSAHSNVLGSISSTSHTYEIFHYDEYLANNQNTIDEFLINCCRQNKPDLLFVSYYPVANDPRNIKLETFLEIKNLDIPVVFIWFDAGHKHIEELSIKCSEFNTLNVIVDVYNKINDKFLPMTVPQDENLFCLENNKTNDVCFVGSRDAYGDRRRYLSFLNGKINLKVSGGQREGRLSIEQYAQLIKNSKISINFPHKADGTVQAKSRIYETMLCNTLLLERENEAITKWFIPGQHYVSFTDENDLLKKIRFYLKREDERLRIAKNGYNKMKELYNSQWWWDTVINKAKELQ